MANPNGPLIPGLSYDYLLQVKKQRLSPPDIPESLPEILESPLPLTVTTPQLHQQREEPSESVMDVKTEPMEMEDRINQCQEPKQHQVIKSIGDLAALSAAIDAFKRQYDDLQKHVEFIQNAIDSRLNGVTAGAVKQSPQESAGKGTEALNKPEAKRFCELMCSKGLRKYISSNLSEAEKLMEEIPKALKLAKKPAKLVLDCIGRFYLQGSKAFVHDSPMIPARKASLLILECFLLMAGNAEVESSVRADAEAAAVAWRKRLITEGGLAKAEQPDARGLLLLIAGFGVPSSFRNEDLLDLMRQSNSFEIFGALRRSAFLVPMIPGLIDDFMKRGMHIEAVELVYIFGLEDKFSAPSILTAFLRMNYETFQLAKQRARSTLALKSAIENQLTALISVVWCLESFKLDPAKVLPGWQIKDQIIKLEKGIFELNKDIEEERSIRIMEERALTNRLYNQGIKRPRFTGMESPVASSSYSPVYHDQGFSIQRERDDITALVSSYLGTSTCIPLRSNLGSSRQDVAANGLGKGLPSYDPRMDCLPPGNYSPIREQTLPVQQSSIGRQSLYRPTLSIEGFTALPNYSSNGISSSNRHGFIDTVQ